MYRPCFLMITCIVLGCGAALGGIDDPVGKKLAGAKEEFGKAGEKARAGLLTDLKKREEAAQKAGDLKTLEKVQAEAKAFADSGTLPKSVPVKGYEGQLRTARARLDESFEAAVKQYTKDGNIALAKAVQKELDEFRKGDPKKSDDRQRWVHAQGEFRLLKDGEWEEKAANGKTYKYKEFTRNKDYIEVGLPTGDAALNFRIYEGRCDWMRKGDAGYTTVFSSGKWVR